MNPSKIMALALAMAATAPLHAQTATPPAAATTVKLDVGAKVYGAQGSEVGTIEKVEGDTIIVNTGKNSAALARSAFSSGPQGPQIGFTKEQLDAAIAEAAAKTEAKVEAALVAGATVKSSDGVAVGTVKTVNTDGTVVLEDKGEAFALKKDTFTADASGVSLRITAKQLAEARGKTAAAPAGS